MKLAEHLHFMFSLRRLLINITDFWDIETCSLKTVYRRFRGAYCLHYQARQYVSLKRRSTSSKLHGPRMLSSQYIRIISKDRL
jgi:hypothetical protein